VFVDTPSFGFFANPNLQPEKSVGYDAGFEQTVGEDDEIRLNLFSQRISNLIASNDTFTNQHHVGKAEPTALKTSSITRLVDRDDAGDTPTRCQRRGEATGAPAATKHKASLTTSWQLPTRCRCRRRALCRTVDRRQPRFLDTAAADRRLHRVQRGWVLRSRGGVSAFARIDNLFDSATRTDGISASRLGVFAGCVSTSALRTPISQ